MVNCLGTRGRFRSGSRSSAYYNALMNVSRGVAFVVFSMSAAVAAQPADSNSCMSPQQCSEVATAAIARAEYEDAHTLAWRGVQLSGRNDVNALYLLARTQSLSGRPHDALVMLQRLTAQGFRAVDAETSDEFRRVRTLAGWPELLAAIRGAPLPTPTPIPGSTPPTVSAAPAAREEGLEIPESAPTPTALAHDGVSGRFVVAQDGSDVLSVIDERSGRAVTLVSAGWSGAYRTSALAIDKGRGDLWVAGIDETAEPRSALHKLQLVSGRLLQTFPLPADAGVARLVDVAVSRQHVFLLDAKGRRVFSLPAGAKNIRMQVALDARTDPVSVAASSDAVLYVANNSGVTRIDLTTRTQVPVVASNGVDLSGLDTISWHDGAIFGIQHDAVGARRAVQIRLNARGTVAASLVALGAAHSRAATVGAHGFCYIAHQPDGTRRIVRAPFAPWPK
jgi:hypothetical protein